MLSDDEKRFILYWEKNREKEKRVFRQLMIGLPIGVLFGIAIAINFSLGWYKRAQYVANSKFNPVILVIAVFCIAAFVAIFSKRHKWEMNEQRYLEFKAKRDKEETNEAAKATE
ncbi:MAG: hypothetical protein H7Y03_15300 [Chitinophagaceae bacterium]|nr:hypothetical protein [Chitinophagaceae bacterium]